MIGRWGDGETWRLDELRLCEREKGRMGDFEITNYELRITI